MKYKIELTCWDYGEPKPYKDEVDQIFDNEKDAMTVLLQCVIDEADSLNKPDAYGNRGRYFSIDLEGGDGCDAVIRCWDGPDDYINVTGYRIVEVAV